MQVQGPTFPLHVPRVTPRESGWLGAAGMELVQLLLTVITGRPPKENKLQFLKNMTKPTGSLTSKGKGRGDLEDAGAD